MHVGALHVELRIRGMRSLKEKRRVVKRIIAEVGTPHPIAVAEVDHQDLWQRAALGIAAVSESPGQIDRMLASIMRDLEQRTDIEILGSGRFYLDEEDR